MQKYSTRGVVVWVCASSWLWEATRNSTADMSSDAFGTVTPFKHTSEFLRSHHSCQRLLHSPADAPPKGKAQCDSISCIGLELALCLAHLVSCFILSQLPLALHVQNWEWDALFLTSAEVLSVGKRQVAPDCKAPEKSSGADAFFGLLLYQRMELLDVSVWEVPALPLQMTRG